MNSDQGEDDLKIQRLPVVESTRILNDDDDMSNHHGLSLKSQDEEFVSLNVNDKHQPRRQNKRHGARNQHKMKYFAQWIHETFLNDSITDMAQGSHHHYHHILDVAGGKGELSARLVLCCSTRKLKVTMVDPRPADITSVYQNWIVPKLPKKWQQQYEFNCSNNPNFIHDILQERYIQLPVYFTTDRIESDDALRSAIQNCTLMIGMHADSATECIVDTALQYNKPFVVVPCCVFPNLFQQRFLYRDFTLPPSSTDALLDDPIATRQKIPVRSYEQFCDYLYQKDKRFQRTVLPFDGRNQAIWWDGK